MSKAKNSQNMMCCNTKVSNLGCNGETIEEQHRQMVKQISKPRSFGAYLVQEGMRSGKTQMVKKIVHGISENKK